MSKNAIRPNILRRISWTMLLTFLVAPAVAADEQDRIREEYELMKLFVDTYQQVEANYVRDVDRRELVEAAIQGMLQHLDQYSSFIPEDDYQRFNQVVEQEFGGIGINVGIRDGVLTVISPLPGTPAYRAGIRAGDVIVEVEGESTENFTMDDAIARLQGPAGRPVTIKVEQPGDEAGPRELQVVREVIQVPTVFGDSYNDDGTWDFMYDDKNHIGYIRVTHFSRFTAKELREAVEKLEADGAAGLVLDLRFNPGGLLESAIEIADMFLDEGRIVSVRGRNVPERSWEAKTGDTVAPMPLAVLVNGSSASASEVLSACLQDNNRAVIIGERTWGKGSVQNVIRMEQGSSALKLTTASYHRPSGVNIHRFPNSKSTDEWGVSPDEGYLIPYSRREWIDWQLNRRARDVFRNRTSDDSETEGPAFEDRQLTTALKVIREKLNQDQNAESTEPASAAEESASPVPAGAP